MGAWTFHSFEDTDSNYANDNDSEDTTVTATGNELVDCMASVPAPVDLVEWAWFLDRCIEPI